MHWGGGGGREDKTSPSHCRKVPFTAARLSDAIIDCGQFWRQHDSDYSRPGSDDPGATICKPSPRTGAPSSKE